MLSPQFKAGILAKAGMKLPAFPGTEGDAANSWTPSAGHAPSNHPEGEAGFEAAVEKWNQMIEARFAEYAAARAAKSLRESIDADCLQRLRDANLGGGLALKRGPQRRL